MFHKSLITPLKEPSSWAGFSGVFVAAASQVEKTFAHPFITASVFCGIIAIFLKDPVEEKKDAVDKKSDNVGK